MFTTRILHHRNGNASRQPVTTGAASFKRLLGCAPMPVARILLCSDSWALRHRFLNTQLRPDGRMGRRSDLQRRHRPPRATMPAPLGTPEFGKTSTRRM